MKFKLHTERIETLKEYAIKFIKRQIKSDIFWALKNVSVDIEKNESLAVVGRNGAGKSTLLKIIAGVISPTTGSIKVNGTIAPLLNLGAGFDHALTAHENIFLNGAMLGYSHKEMKLRYDSIVEFSELKDFLNVPIMNFSSGMVARLGFSIASDVNADILIADEILSAGDAGFRKKCEKRIADIKNRGTTFILVSHNMSTVKSMCQKALWLDKGTAKMYGGVDEVCAAYLADVNREEEEKEELKLKPINI